MVTHSSLIVLSPIKQSDVHNVVRIHRETDVDSERLLLVAGGPHTGIIINKLNDIPYGLDADVEISFSVWINNGTVKKQEKRHMFFKLNKDVDLNEGRAVVHAFFKQLMSNLPNTYVDFMKRVLKMLQSDYLVINSLDLEYKILSDEEQVAIPDAAQYDSSSEAEDVTVGHVQEVLEHAYPNGLTIDIICDSLRCTPEEASQFLLELEASGIVRRVGDEWIRVDTRNVDAVARGNQSSGADGQPTVAIITCLFVEKQAVDSLIDDSSVIHKYKSGGDSNVYTIGRIGPHNVVATKLALIGDSREAITSAGSITTRLLGNFQKIEHVFIVGVGGAVPHYTDARLHARLGDVVVSSSMPEAYIYSHDLILDRKTEALTEALTGFATRKWSPKDHQIENLVKDGGEQLKIDWNTLTDEAVNRLNSQASDNEFTAPPNSTDVLAMSVPGGNVIVLPHPNADRKGAEIHFGAVGAVANIKKPNAENEAEEETASQLRERFAAEFHLRALDAGFDSVVASIVGNRIDSWALVRGVSDYQHGQSRSMNGVQKIIKSVGAVANIRKPHAENEAELEEFLIINMDRADLVRDGR
ncbi:unnamed protein product [Auanema sp. JU1783]|nr:unnamed protein product [Auanema sp. JU1783]